jgi:nitrous oxidase accessory protein NosD
MTVRNPGRRALLYGGPAVAAGAVLLSGTPAQAGVAGDAASPKDFGAAGDGVTDDTAAINRCLAASRLIDFGGPDNTYLITGTLLAERTVSQVLTGGGATIKAGAGVNMLRLKQAGHSVSGIVFDGNNQSTGCGIIVEATAPGSEADGCAFVDVAGPGLSIGAERVRVTGNSFRACGRLMTSPYNTTIFAADAHYVTIAGNEMLDCDWGVYFRGSADDPGIQHYSCAGNIITCRSPAPVASQGISNRFGRFGRIQDNTIVGFADNSIDCGGCNNITIIGNNTTGGKDGVFVGDTPSSSVTITGNTFRSPQRGVRILGTADNALIIGIVVAGNTVARPTGGGILVEEDGLSQVTGITVADNDVHLAGSGDYGIRVVNAEVSRISGNRVYRPLGIGIDLIGTDLIQVTDNTIEGASYLTPAGTTKKDAISVAGANRSLIRNNLVYGGARYAVTITSGTGMTVTGTRWRSIEQATGISNAATGTVLADNVGL